MRPAAFAGLDEMRMKGSALVCTNIDSTLLLAQDAWRASDTCGALTSILIRDRA